MNILVLDCNNLAHRAMFKVGTLTHREKTTGVLFGFINSIIKLADTFNPVEILFCWDSHLSFRKRLFSEYKSLRRKNLTKEEVESREVAYYQFAELQHKILPRLGFANVYHQEGIEADDLIAKVIIDHYDTFYRVDSDYSPFIIVSSDNDLFQILPYCKGMYDPNKKFLITATDFTNEWKISPSLWLEVKAMAGDNSDNIPGILGVGVKTAIKFITGQKTSFNVSNRIAISQSTIALNKKLMKIPHPSTKSEQIKKSEFNLTEFEAICLENGFNFFLKTENYNKIKQVFRG